MSASPAIQIEGLAKSSEPSTPRRSVSPAIRIQGLAKSYESSTGRTVVLEDVDLTVEAGAKVSITGPSGSGKSTLLSLIAGLLRPHAGSIEIAGVPLADLDDAARADLRARHIGIALQADNLIPFLSARENVELALSFATRRPSAKRAMELLDQMAVVHRSSHLPRQLSGGEAQRVALAVAIANEPALLLADEMVAQLDASTAGQVVDAVFGTDMTVLFVTHDIELADRASQRLRLHDRTVAPR
jgi:putative ABC transport system ATP-binding protein